MKTIICFVLILTITVAKDGDVYVYNNRDYYGDKPIAKRKPWSPLIVDYHWGDMLSMNIYLTNIASDVAADMYLIYPLGVTSAKKKLSMDKLQKKFEIHRYLKFSKIFIELELSTTAGLCITYNIVNATSVTPGRQHNSYNDICLMKKPCVIEVDLLNNICEYPSEPDGPTNQPFKPTDETTTKKSTGSDTDPSEPDGPTNQPFKPTDETTTKKSTGSDTGSNYQQKLKTVLTYVIPSVSVTCVIILAIYTIVKKYCRRNLNPVDTLECNTATANEVVYAELSLVGGDNQLPRRDEESTYAKIIGVMKPVPR